MPRHPYIYIEREMETCIYTVLSLTQQNLRFYDKEKIRGLNSAIQM